MNGRDYANMRAIRGDVVDQIDVRAQGLSLDQYKRLMRLLLGDVLRRFDWAKRKLKQEGAGGGKLSAEERRGKR